MATGNNFSASATIYVTDAQGKVVTVPVKVTYSYPTPKHAANTAPVVPASLNSADVHLIAMHAAGTDAAASL
jgi:hypothetical protein